MIHNTGVIVKDMTASLALANYLTQQNYPDFHWVNLNPEPGYKDELTLLQNTISFKSVTLNVETVRLRAALDHSRMHGNSSGAYYVIESDLTHLLRELIEEQVYERLEEHVEGILHSGVMSPETLQVGTLAYFLPEVTIALVDGLMKLFISEWMTQIALITTPYIRLDIQTMNWQRYGNTYLILLEYFYREQL